jgi:serine protease Do
MVEMKNSIASVAVPAKKYAKTLGIVFLVMLSAAAGFVGGWAGSKANRQGAFNAETSQQIISSESELISKIAKDVGPSVVSVNVTSATTQSGFFGFSPSEQESAGTGFIVSAEGLIVTNRHVVAGGDHVTVTLSDGTELTDIEVVGQTNQGDPLDVAFLKVTNKKGKDLKPIKIGDSSKMEVGDKVVAIGNALGQFQNTVTTGIISGYGRDVQASDGSGASTESLQNLFQTDAAINQGNSGGPLVNLSGEVVGINTAVAGEGAENIGFAIPIDDTKGLISSVLEKGKLERPYLGVRYVSLTDDYAYEFNLKTKRGAYIVPSEASQPSILKDSPAEKAGLKEKDVITKINGDSINEKSSLTTLMSKYKVGEQVTLTVIRDNREQQIKVTLQASPES